LGVKKSIWLVKNDASFPRRFSSGTSGRRNQEKLVKAEKMAEEKNVAEVKRVM